MKVSITQHVVGEISEYDAIRIARELIYKAAGWTAENYIDDKQTPPALMKLEEYATSHTWTEKIFVREATPLDLAVKLVLSKL